MGSHAFQIADAPADVRAVMDELRRIVRALRLSAAEAEKAAGLSGAQLFVLQRLFEKDARSIAELAERTLTDASSVSVLLARLEEKGLVERERSPADLRKTSIALTKRGKALLEKTPLPAQARLVEALASMPGLERRSLQRALGRLAAAMTDSPEAPLFFEDPPARKKR